MEDAVYKLVDTYRFQFRNRALSSTPPSNKRRIAVHMLNGRVYVNSLNGIGYGDLEDTTTFQDHGLLFGLLFLNKTKKKRNYRYKLALFLRKCLCLNT